MSFHGGAYSAQSIRRNHGFHVWLLSKWLLLWSTHVASWAGVYGWVMRGDPSAEWCVLAAETDLPFADQLGFELIIAQHFTHSTLSYSLHLRKTIGQVWIKVIKVYICLIKKSLAWKGFSEIGIEATAYGVILRHVFHFQLIQTLNLELSTTRKKLNDSWNRLQHWLVLFGHWEPYVKWGFFQKLQDWRVDMKAELGTTWNNIVK